MLHEGMIGIPKKDGSTVRVRYQVITYEDGSMFGINEGHISNIRLSINGHQVANYDRGRDVEPTCEEAELALAILLQDYN